MDRDKDNVWTRRAGNNNHNNNDSSVRNNRSNPFNNITPLATTNISGASSAFGLGSGAFGFGSSAKSTPKTPTPASALTGPPAAFDFPPSSSSQSPFRLKSNWIVWYRPPSSKNSDYEKSIKPLCRMSTVVEFWQVYSHLKRPSMLPVVSDYHFFKHGIRPVWEDEENRRGGKWIIRLKKGVADRYWEHLLMAMVGNQFAEAGDEVCGAVLSVRSGEDVLSIWTKNDGGRNIKIRETLKRILELPADTVLAWKSHDDCIAQRSALDQARQEKSTA